MAQEVTSRDELFRVEGVVEFLDVSQFTDEVFSSHETVADCFEVLSQGFAEV